MANVDATGGVNYSDVKTYKIADSQDLSEMDPLELSSGKVQKMSSTGIIGTNMIGFAAATKSMGVLATAGQQEYIGVRRAGIMEFTGLRNATYSNDINIGDQVSLYYDGSAYYVVNDTENPIGEVVEGSMDSNGSSTTILVDVDLTPENIVNAEIAAPIILDADNSTAFRVKGASNDNSASSGSEIQNYVGMFFNDNYNNAASGGTKKNRMTFGANQDMDLVLQGPHQIRIVAADNNVTGGDADTATDNGVGNILMISRSDITLSPWAAPEALGDNYVVITSITETVYDAGAGSYKAADMVIKANTGNLYLNYNVTDGAPIVNSLTDSERDALTGVKGMIIYNETHDEYQVYDGGWKAISVGAVSS